jgi:PAS domain S-box-containing protein
MRSERILIVEDEALIAEEIRERLTEAGYTVIAVADTGVAAIELVAHTRPNLVLMDIRLKGGMDGVEAAQAIFDRFAVPVVYLTAYSDQATLQRAKTRAAFGFVLKPFQVESLLIAIELGIHRAAIEARLEKHQLAFATILGSVSDAVITTDVAGRVRFMNAVAEQLTGRAAREAEGRQFGTVVRLVDESGRPAQERLVKRVAEARAPLRFARSDHLIRHGGERIPVDGGAAPVIDYLGRLVGINVTFTDATDARRGEHELRMRSEELQVVVDAAVDGVLLLDRDGTVRMFNPACERLFGYARDEVIGRSVLQLMPSPLADTAAGPAQAAASQRHPFVVGRTAVGRRKDGGTIPIEVSVGEAYRDGALEYVVVVHDVAERRELQDAYADAIGHEQRRIARDLHDGLGQELTGIALLLSALERAASEANLPNAADLGRVRDLAGHTIATCRSVARGLMPVAEIQGGLVAGLRELVRQLNELAGPPVHFSVIEAATVGLSAAATDHLYHIAQEALTNAIKHAAAHAIQLTLDVGRSSVRLSVCDDGNGIVAAQSDTAGLGLRTMRYRADLIGARISIQPQARAGTCVVCECPQPL